MADITSVLPVSKDRNANSQTNPFWVELSDGTDAIAINADGSLNVNATQAGSWSVTVLNGAGGSAVNIQDGGNSITVDGTVAVSSITTSVTPGTSAAHLGKAEDAAHASGDTGVAVWGVRNDSFSTTYGANGDYTPIAVDASGRVFTAATKLEDAVHASGDAGAFILGVRNDTFATLAGSDGDYSPIATDSAGRVAVRPLGVVSEDAAHVSGDSGNFILAVRNSAGATLTSADGDYSPVATDAAGFIRSDIAAQTLTALKISKDTNANSATNPIYVQEVSGTVSTVEVQDYNTASAVASAATSNHDYASVSTTFLLKRVWATASGAIKVEVLVGPVAALVTKAVGFSSMANPNVDMVFDPPLEVPTTSTGTTRVSRTNRELVAMDVYSTIYGYQT